MAKPSNADKLQSELLHWPIGAPNSGYVRYGAAMYFFQSGMLAEQVLEIYRECCKEDWVDPIARLQKRGIAPAVPSID